jgi:hypothetical protein
MCHFRVLKFKYPDAGVSVKVHLSIGNMSLDESEKHVDTAKFEAARFYIVNTTETNVKFCII